MQFSEVSDGYLQTHDRGASNHIIRIFTDIPYFVREDFLLEKLYDFQYWYTSCVGHGYAVITIKCGTVTPLAVVFVLRGFVVFIQENVVLPISLHPSLSFSCMMNKYYIRGHPYPIPPLQVSPFNHFGVILQNTVCNSHWCILCC